MEIRYPEYFRVKATTIILYACGSFLKTLRNTNKISSTIARERLLFSLNLVRPRICILYLFFYKHKIVVFYLFYHEPNFKSLPVRFKEGVP
jgi:hypothetical protein